MSVVRDSDSQAPPPSPALLAAVARIQPVSTRVPARTFIIVVCAALVVPLLTVAVARPRADLSALSLVRVLGMALVWAVAATLAFKAALIPPPGQVLSNAARAGIVAVAGTLSLLLITLLTSDAAPGRTVAASAFGATAWHCLRSGLLVTIPVLIVGAILLRRAFPMGGVQIGAALGAAGGAVAGLMLHLICSVGGGLHVATAHGGGMVLGALLGAVVLPRFLRV